MLYKKLLLDSKQKIQVDDTEYNFYLFNFYLIKLVL